MFSSNDLSKMLKDVMTRLNTTPPCNTTDKNGTSKDTVKKINLNPSQTLVIGGILCGLLDVDSLLVDKDQAVQIVLSGSLKKKTELEKMLDEIGSMSFDEVLKAMLGRL